MLQAAFLAALLGLARSVDIKILDDIEAQQLKDEVWTWKCGDGHCKKTAVADGVRPIGEDVCKLACKGDGALWPKPTGNINISTTLLRINPHNVRLASKPESHGNTEVAETIMEAFEVFSEIIRSKDTQGTANGKILEVYLNIKNPEVYKYVQGADEGYSLFVSTGAEGKINGTIVSETFLGARHGLETLSQLVVGDSASGELLTSSKVEISDAPAYTHRGIALDTARNFVTVASIKRTLDAMASNKLNTFHWHITDSHSFPLYSQAFPNLTRYGAYSKQKVYTEDDIRDLVRYARIRGIRIVPEFDAPAHVGEGWQWADGAVVCFAAEPWTSYCVEPPCGQLNPTKDIVYTVLQGIFADMARLFDSDHFHMGGDEVNMNCWNSTETIVTEMAKLGFNRTNEGFHALWAKFQDKSRIIAAEKFGPNVRPILWTSTLTEGSHLTTYLNSSDYVIQIWTKGNDATIAHLVNNGFQVIFSNYDALYFDCGFGAWVGNGNNWCSPYIPWQTVYENDPKKILSQLGVNTELHRLALGSEAALWTEQADDFSLDNRFWPRAAAMGEGLWSGEGRWQDAEHRLLVQRKRLIERGVHADTLQPEWCSHHQGACYL